MASGWIDWLFPPQCARCREPGSGLCERCAPECPPLVRFLPTLRVTALAEYSGAWRGAVLAVKDGRRDVAAALGERLAIALRGGDAVVPVPTASARVRARGCDGVREIARSACARAGAVLHPALASGGGAQRGRTRVERLRHGERFSCALALTGVRAILLDDVCTTGATLEDCARALRSAGAVVEEAVVVTLA